jgi:hypothetical protein
VRKNVDADGSRVASSVTAEDGFLVISGMAAINPDERVTIKKPLMTMKRK